MTVPAMPFHALTDEELRAIATNRVRFNPEIRREAAATLARRGAALA